MANIAIDARPLANPTDGITRFTSELVQRLVCYENHNWYLYSHKSTKSHFSSALTRWPKGGLQQSLLVSQLRFPRWADLDQIDVFWSPRHHLPLRLDKPSIVTIHDLCWLKYPQTMPLQRCIAERLLMPPAISRARLITTPSQSVADEVASFWPEKQHAIRVIKPGLPESSHALPQEERNKPFLLTVGTIEPRKNYALLLDAFSLLKNKIEHDLVIVGRSGWGGVNLDELTEARGLQARVTWLKDITDNQLMALYRDTDLYCTASTYEGCNLPLLEAQTYGAKVVATDIPVHMEVTGANATLAAMEPNAFADALLTALRTRRLDDPFISRGYDWGESTKLLLSLMESLI